MSEHISVFTGMLRGAMKQHALLYVDVYRISTVDVLFHAIRRFRPPHSIGKMKRQKLLKEIEIYESKQPTTNVKAGNSLARW
jgi:hypothetical protein